MPASDPAPPARGRQQWMVASILLVVVSLTVVNWVLRPEQALRWARGMLLLPSLWLGLLLWRRALLKSWRRRGLDDETGIVRYFRSAIALLFLAAGVRQITVLGLALWSQFGAPGLSLEAGRRMAGLASSAVFVILGNGLPKILTPLSMLPLEQAEMVTTARRFAGTTMLVLGLVAALAFLSAPLSLATTVLKGVAGASIMTVLGVIIWMNVTPVRRKG